MPFIYNPLHMCLLVAVLLVSACGGGGGGGASPTTSQTATVNNVTFASTVNIAAVNALMIAPAGFTNETVAQNSRNIKNFLFEILGIKSAYAQQSNSKFLYALDATDNLNVLNLLQQISSSGQRSSFSVQSQIQNQSISIPRVTGMIDTKLFVYLGFENLYKPDSQGDIDQSSINACSILALQKSNGSVSCLNIFPMCSRLLGCVSTWGGYGYGREDSFVTNLNGDIAYVFDQSESLVKIDLTDPANISQTTLINGSSGSTNRNLVVNDIGEAFYAMTDSTARIYLLNGTYVSVTAPVNNDISCVVTGASGTGYANDFFYMVTATKQVRKYQRVNQSTFTDTLVYDELNPNTVNEKMGINQCQYVAKTNGTTYTIGGPNFTNNNIVQELVNSTNTPEKIQFSDFYTLKNIYQYATGFVVWGVSSNSEDGLSRYKTADSSISAPLATSRGYSIKNLTVSDSGQITFMGSRNSDSAKVVATIDNLNNVIIKQYVTRDITAIANVR